MKVVEKLQIDAEHSRIHVTVSGGASPEMTFHIPYFVAMTRKE